VKVATCESSTTLPFSPQEGSFESSGCRSAVPSRCVVQNIDLRRVRRQSETSIVDKRAIIPILACAFATIVNPCLEFAYSTGTGNLQAAAPGLSGRIFWPAIFGISLVLAARNQFSPGKLTLAPHVKWLLAYVAFAGLSTLWAFKPEISFIRYTQQVMIISSIVLPALLAARTVDWMRGLFLCYALGVLLNFCVALNTPPSALGEVSGYFLGKNYLGEFAAPALLLGFFEAFHPGLRRPLGIIVAILSALLLYWSQCKTALGFVLFSPILAGLALIVRKRAGVSIAITIFSIPFCYEMVSNVSPNINAGRISYMLYHDSTFTGRTIIWAFAQQESERRPLLGWGYQSFWLVGSDAPSVVEAPSFVGQMPEGHNGYVDTKLELGYIGYTLLLIFIFTTLHAIGRVADRDPTKALLVLSLALYVMVHNLLESLWMRGLEFLWLLFLILVVEIARYWQPFPQRRAAQSIAVQRRGAGSSRASRMPRPRMGLS
jgi:exopolysaccharide production protein ExoQ